MRVELDDILKGRCWEYIPDYLNSLEIDKDLIPCRDFFVSQFKIGKEGFDTEWQMRRSEGIVNYNSIYVQQNSDPLLISCIEESFYYNTHLNLDKEKIWDFILRHLRSDNIIYEKNYRSIWNLEPSRFIIHSCIRSPEWIKKIMKWLEKNVKEREKSKKASLNE